MRSYRKSCFQQSSTAAAKSKPAAPPEEKAPAAPAAAAGGNAALFVKVSMDGAPYLRKVDLKMYKGYRELREALEAMFLGFSGGGADAPAVNPSDFAVTYEDKDGDWMLVGDVPWRSALIRTPSSLFLHPVVISGYSFNKNKNHMFKFI